MKEPKVYLLINIRLYVLSVFSLTDSSENSAKKEKPADVLPISPMVLALSTVRQSKFFQARYLD
jgi:hypothetical protein